MIGDDELDGPDYGMDADRAALKRAMSDVRPLPGRGKLHTPPSGGPPRVPARPPRRVRFEISAFGERVDGRADGVPERTLARLRAGEVPLELEVDLHRLDAASAERRLRDRLAAARRAGTRCVLVIHGRGRHSGSGPVLKEALVDWLQRPPLAHAVMAFASAIDRDGGTGATYVLLRRQR